MVAAVDGVTAARLTERPRGGTVVRRARSDVVAASPYHRRARLIKGERGCRHRLPAGRSRVGDGRRHRAMGLSTVAEGRPGVSHVRVDRGRGRGANDDYDERENGTDPMRP